MGVGWFPIGPARRVGADNMIVGENMGKTEFLRGLTKVFDVMWIGADLGLRKNHSNSHFLALRFALGRY